MVQVPFREALRAWMTIAVHSFGGPAGQIAVMHRVLVEEKGWFTEKRFLHALNYCMLLPGPEAMQLATYSGWLLHGVRGGLVAGCLFVLPGFLSILALSIAYALYADTAWVVAAFWGIKAAVLAIVLDAFLRIGRRMARNGATIAIAAAAFVAMFLDAPFPLVIVVAGLTAWRLGRARPAWFPAPDTDGEEPAPVKWRPTLRTAATWLAVWWVPVGLLGLALGLRHVLVQQAWFFSKAAVVTFGGAYAVLAYIAQQAVEVHGWLQPGEMLDGLGMAESTPGPLIQVVQFVGFLGAFRDALPFSPLVAGILASIVVTWVTFVPSFLFVFTGAPYVEALRRRVGLHHALAGITAAVLGVVLNLAVWFGLHVLWSDVRTLSWGQIALDVPAGAFDVWGAALAAAAFVALRRKVPMLAVLAVAIGLGIMRI